MVMFWDAGVLKVLIALDNIEYRTEIMAVS